MDRRLKKAAALVASGAAAIATLWGGVKVWDEMRLPRPAMKSELDRVADASTDTRARVLILQKEAAENAAREIELTRYKLQADDDPIPPSLYAMENEKKDEAAAIQREIERLETEAP